MFWNWQKRLILEKPDSPLGDELQFLVKKIESFAPREFRTERAEYYYHYSAIHSYLIPLMRILRTISIKVNSKQMDFHFARELCIALKSFYDVKGKYTLDSILSDSRFIAKYRQIFQIFYGRLGPRQSTISEWIHQIKEETIGSQGI